MDHLSTAPPELSDIVDNEISKSFVEGAKETEGHMEPLFELDLLNITLGLPY